MMHASIQCYISIQFQNQMGGIFKEMREKSLDEMNFDLNSIEEMLQEAETAAGLLGTQAQLSSVAISRRQFEELKEAVSWTIR